MHPLDTAETVRRFNRAFEEHRPELLAGLVAPDCVMETMQPAPDGTRYEGHDVNLAFWQAMAADRVNRFEVEETLVLGEHANVRWRFHLGNGSSVRGVTLMRVRDGQVLEALAYAKSPGEAAPLPEVTGDARRHHDIEE